MLEQIGDRVPEAAAACERMARMLALVAEHGAGDAVVVDLGVMRDWPYYSGVVYEAYAPGVGEPIAMGGRYDGLAGRFGRARPAVGFAIVLDVLHRALMTAGADAGAAPRGRGAGRRARRGPRRGGRGPPARAWPWWRCPPPTATARRRSPRPTAGASSPGRAGDGYTVLDRVTGERRAGVARLEEALPSPG